MIADITIRKNSYKDSVRLLEATRAMKDVDGVEYAWVVMGTPANVDTLREEGFDSGLDDVGANDLVLAVRADGSDAVQAAHSAADDELFGVAEQGPEAVELPTGIGAAVEAQPSTNVAIISVPGPYAALETHKALSAGLDVLLFSDNVPLEDEIELKDRAAELGRLVMGPGAGTAMLAGTGLGFSNRVGEGPIGIIAAAGTGAQEVMSLVDRWGVGVSHVIGLGGRDLSEEVGGRMARSAIAALDADPRTETILLVSKPPSAEVAREILALPEKPMVAALIGLRDEVEAPDHVTVCNTLEAGARLTLERRGDTVPDLVGDLAERVADTITGLAPKRTRLVGLYSGGTLCFEAMTIAVDHLGPIHSNTPLDPDWGLPAPEGAHVCLDLGEEEYTQGRPHPMIDPAARNELLLEQAEDPTIAAVLLDVVIGDGAHPDPAGMLSDAVRAVTSSGAAVVAYLLGTERDPQGLADQRSKLEAAGCIVADTAARAALAATGIALRDPALAGEPL